MDLKYLFATFGLFVVTNTEALTISSGEFFYLLSMTSLLSTGWSNERIGEWLYSKLPAQSNHKLTSKDCPKQLHV